MEEKTNKQPRLRFPEFKDDWEQRKLGELGSLKNGMNFSKDAMGHGFPFVNLQNIFGNNVVNVNELGLAEASEKQLSEYSLRAGDVLFVRSSVKLEGVGEAALVPENLENTTYSGFIIRFRDEFGLNNDFKKFIFGTQAVRNQIMAQATNSANKNISQGVLENLTFDVPSFDEQAKIGSYFTNLDNLITLHQRKCDKLKDLKKCMLQKMFPKDGEKVPEIRFPGFTEDWEQRKLSDIVVLFGGNAFSSKDSLATGARWLKIANVGIGHLKWEEESFLPISYLDTYPEYQLHIGDYVMALTRPILNRELKIAEITEENILLNQRVAKLIFDCNKDFGYQLLRKTSTVDMIDNELAGTDPPNLGTGTLKNIDVSIPGLEEQEKIGDYFTNLDNLITLHQRKCDSLKELKKAMLQKMFV